MNPRDAEHLKWLRWINIAQAVLAFALAAMFLLVFAGAGLLAVRKGELEGWFFVVIGVAVTVFAAAMGGLHLWLVALLDEGRGRILQTILAVLQVANVPVGTAYGLYALWVSWSNPGTKAVFDAAERGGPPS